MNQAAVSEGLRALHAALDSLAGAADEAAGPADLGWVLSEVARAEARLASVKLMLVAAAEASGAARDDGSSDTAAWAARAVGGNRPRSWGPVWLASALRESYHATAAALADGRIGEEHAAIIVAAGRSIPDAVPDAITDGVTDGITAGITAEELARCEEALVAKAERMKPAALRRAA